MRSAMRRGWKLAAAALAAAPAALLAHPFHGGVPAGGAGLAAGLVHPLTGADHVLLAVGAGLALTSVRGRAGRALGAALLAAALIGLTLEAHPSILRDPAAVLGMIASTSALLGLGAAAGRAVRRRIRAAA